MQLARQASVNPDEPHLPEDFPRRPRPVRGRSLLAPLFAAAGRLSVFLPIFASGIFAVWVSRRAEEDPAVALRNTALATTFQGGLVLLYFVRSKSGLRWVGLAQLLVTLLLAVLVALRFVTNGKVPL